MEIKAVTHVTCFSDYIVAVCVLGCRAKASFLYSYFLFIHVIFYIFTKRDTRVKWFNVTHCAKLNFQDNKDNSLFHQSLRNVVCRCLCKPNCTTNSCRIYKSFIKGFFFLYLCVYTGNWQPLINYRAHEHHSWFAIDDAYKIAAKFTEQPTTGQVRRAKSAKWPNKAKVEGFFFD